MDLVIDVGNTATKLGFFQGESLKGKHRFEHDRDEWILPEYTPVDRCIVSSTREIPVQAGKLYTAVPDVVLLSAETPLPFTNRYRTPETLGYDRIAGIAGIQKHYPDRHALVIDAGTSLTFDLITKDKQYLGGKISPGLAMRYRALHTFTGRLPLVSHEDYTGLVGDTTETCIRSGVFMGMVEEINGTIHTLAGQYPDLVVGLCGGDADHLVNHIKYRIFALPNLVLLGLHQILTYNAIRSHD